jgi:hypothetical protein
MAKIFIIIIIGNQWILIVNSLVIERFENNKKEMDLWRFIHLSFLVHSFMVHTFINRCEVHHVWD